MEPGPARDASREEYPADFLERVTMTANAPLTISRVNAMPKSRSRVEHRDLVLVDRDGKQERYDEEVPGPPVLYHRLERVENILVLREYIQDIRPAHHDTDAGDTGRRWHFVQEEGGGADKKDRCKREHGHGKGQIREFHSP